MGYDNDCIVNIHSIPGEYFCAVCRMLIIPNEALQAHCAHLYCKRCLAYLVATTTACPYDGYTVTEASSKPLVESSKELVEAIGKVAVHCLYRRSNCQWQGTLAESMAHCAKCNFGNSLFLCNRCGNQIMHRKVQEHAQICLGVFGHAQVVEKSQAQDATVATATSAGTTAVASTTDAPAAAASASTAATSAAFSQAQVQGSAVVHPQAITSEQWCQQQYQQYYQQCPGYDSYQQQCQQYAWYQHQVYEHYMQCQIQAIAPQHVTAHQQQPQPQPQVQPSQPQVSAQVRSQLQLQLQQDRPQPQPQPHLQQHPHSKPQSQPQPHVPTQVPQVQPLAPPHQPHKMPQPQVYRHYQPQHPTQNPLSLQSHLQFQRPPMHVQPQPQPHPHPQMQPPLPLVHSYQSNPPMPGAPQQHPMLIHPQQQAVSSQHPPIHMHPQPQPHPHPQMPPPQPSAHSQQSYPLPVPSAWRQHPMLMHPQQQGMSTQHSQSQGHLPPHQHLQVHPLKSHTTMPSQQQPAMPLPYGPGNLHPMQQQIQQAAQLCQFQQQAQRPLHPGQVLQQGSVHQHQHHPHKQSYMQQPAPRRPHPQLNYPPGHVFPPHQAQATNEQLPNQSYMGRANCSVPASSELPSGPIQQTLASHFESQAGVLPASPANPQQRASTLKRVGQMPPSEDGFLVKIAEGTKEREQILESASDSISELKDGEAARDAKEKESHTRNEKKNGSKLHAKNVNVDGSMVKIPGEVTEGSHVVNVHDGKKKVEGQEGKFGEKSYEQFKGEDTHIVSKLHTQPGPDMSVKWERPRPSERANLSLVSDRHSAENVRNMHPPEQYRGSDRCQKMPSKAPKQISCEHPHMPGSGMISEKHPASDKMLPQPMHQSSQERRFLEPPTHQMAVSQEPSWLTPPPGGVLSRHGFPLKDFEQRGVAQNHLSPPHDLGEPSIQPTMSGPLQGAVDPPSRMMGGPLFNAEDKLGKLAAFNDSEADADAHVVRRPRGYDDMPLEPHRCLCCEHSPHGQSKAHGITSNVPVGGMHDPMFDCDLSEDRFRPSPEERLKPFPQKEFKLAHDECVRASERVVNRREFEDKKQVPRPAHLDGEGPVRFDGNLMSRPLDRMRRQPRGANTFTSRPLSYGSNATFPPRSGGSDAYLDIGDEGRSVSSRKHQKRRYDNTFAHRDRHSQVPEFSRHRADGLLPPRSPGYFSGETLDGQPNQLRRGLDNLRPDSFSRDMPSGEVGSQKMPSFLRSGGFHCPLDVSETSESGNLHPPLCTGDPGSGRFISASCEDDSDSFEQSRKRKAVSTIRCLICRIDYENEEALELHCQSREHQKMSMDMVLRIQEGNVEKHRYPENATSFDDGNKSRKGSFKKCAIRK